MKKNPTVSQKKSIKFKTTTSKKLIHNKKHRVYEEIEVLKIIGSWIRDMRQEYGWSQQNLADIMDLDCETIRQIEAGNWNLSIIELIDFAHYLDFYPFLIRENLAKRDLVKVMKDRWKFERSKL